MSARAVEILKSARDLITDPSKWTKKEYARDAEGNRCMTSDTRAATFCAIGAVRHFVDGWHDSKDYDLAMSALNDSVDPFDYVWEFNDNRTHAEVLAAFDRAIVSAETGQ